MDMKEYVYPLNFVGYVCTGVAATLADVVLWKAHSALPLCWLSSFLESFLASEQASSKLAGSAMPQGLQCRHTLHSIESKTFLMVANICMSKDYQM